MCPSNHRNNTEAHARSTFVMTNMVPQTEELNAGSWNDLEIWCRDRCFKENKELYIVCGPHGTGGTSAKGTFKHTDFEQRIVVPSECWKVLIMLDGTGTGPAARVNAKSRVIGVRMPNMREPDRTVPWTKYVVSVASIEQLTGLRFFDKAPADVIGALKRRWTRVHGQQVKGRFGHVRLRGVRALSGYPGPSFPEREGRSFQGGHSRWRRRRLPGEHRPAYRSTNRCARG